MGKKNKKKNLKEDKTMEQNLEERNTEEVVVETTQEVSDTTPELTETENEVLETENKTPETVEEVSNEGENNAPVDDTENQEVDDEEETNEDKEEGIDIALVIGHITCNKLYVRSEANKESASLGIIDSTIDLAIDESNSTEDFYKVTTSNGIEGYCIKDFVKID